jgi:CheY-like chemotaxis protein
LGIAKEEHLDDFQKSLKKNLEATEKANALLAELHHCLAEAKTQRGAIEHSLHLPAATNQNPEVLVVEDLDDDFFFFSRVVSRAKVRFAYIRVNNGLEAKAYLGSNGHRRHLVFLDLKMPLMDGFELMQWLREQKFFGQIQIVILSSSDNSRDRDRARACGVAGYLVKPISIEMLNRSVQIWRGEA